MLRALFNQGTKIVIVGAAFRQAKVVFDYCQDLWDNAPVLRPRRRRPGERAAAGRRPVQPPDGRQPSSSRCRWATAPRFAASVPTSSSPTSSRQHPEGHLRDGRPRVRGGERSTRSPSSRKEMRKAGHQGAGPVDGRPTTTWRTAEVGGQPDHHQRHRLLRVQPLLRLLEAVQGVSSRAGRPEAAGGVCSPARSRPTTSTGRDYCVIRVPVQMPCRRVHGRQANRPGQGDHPRRHVPDGVRRRVRHRLQRVLQAVASSSRASSAAPGPTGRDHPSCGVGPVLGGDAGRPRPASYVMGGRPGVRADNFSVVVLECWPDHRRVVHCWTTTRPGTRPSSSRGLAPEGDFYGYAARKIRDLMR
jgi:hypothetical protein